MSVALSGPQGVDEYIHGVLVHDPYRWLEDRQLPETEAWIREQQQRCDEYFAECGDLSAIRETVASYLDVDTVDQPARIGDRYFFRRRDRSREQGCIYVRDAATGEEKLLVDPSSEGRFVSVGICRISADGSYLAYEVKHGGEDKSEIRVVDTEGRFLQEDGLPNGARRSFLFMPDNRGYLYCHVSTGGQWTIRQHLFGEKSGDLVLLEIGMHLKGRLVMTSDGINIAAVWAYEKDGRTVANLIVASYAKPDEWRLVAEAKTVPYAPWLQGGRLCVLNEIDSSRCCVAVYDVASHELRCITQEIEGAAQQLVGCGDLVYINCLTEDGFKMYCLNLRSCSRTILPLPTPGTIRLLPQEGDGSSLFITHESFTQSREILEYSVDTRSFTVWSESWRPSSESILRVSERYYPSLDGTEIPITLVAKSSTDPAAPRPVIMTGYGGFGAPVTPQFSILVSILIDKGFVFGLPSIRGGGDHGAKWHDAGRLRAKQNSFDDFLGAAKWLIEIGVTTSSKLAAFGGSNGGLLIGAVMTQAPELFQAVVCIAPLLDMVRYESFDQAARWSFEYGKCEVAEDFHILHSYSPYHSIRDGVDYPAVLFVTGDKDERCNPAHVRKTAAKILNRAAQKRRVIVDYEVERGHSPVLPLQTRIDALTRRIAFILRELNLTITAGVIE